MTAHRFRVNPSLLLVRARLLDHRGATYRFAMVETICSLDRHLRLGLSLGLGREFGHTAAPISSDLPRRPGWWPGRCRCTPLRCGRCPDTWSLVGLRVDILRLRGGGSVLV